jgi:hypothetical protein
MYGLVNKAIKDLIVNNHGEDKWREICRLSGHSEEDFIGMNPYPDQLTYDLVGNASKVLGASPEAILEAFGEYWILYTAEEGYGELMELSGDTFPDFLSNLDMLHYRINNIMPELTAPQFTVRDVNNNNLLLEYRSKRAGLSPMLVGLIKGLGKRFGLTTQITQIQAKDDSHDCSIFKIEW